MGLDNSQEVETKKKKKEQDKGANLDKLVSKWDIEYESDGSDKISPKTKDQYEQQKTDSESKNEIEDLEDQA